MSCTKSSITVFAVVLLTSTFTLSTQPSASEATDKAFAIKFPGNQSCQNYMDAGQGEGAEHAFFLGWLNGYLTSFNRNRAQTVDIAPWQGLPLLSGLLLNYCRQNPEKTFLAAVDAMIGALMPTRLKANSALVTIPTEQQPLQLYKTILLRTQQSLTELGYYDGSIDGTFGAMTQNAIEAYQRAKDIPVTGLPDQETLYQLFR